MRSVNRVVLYSVGLLGSSFGLGLRQSGFKGEIIGVSSPNGVAGAVEVGAIDYGVGYGDAREVIESCDMLILCSPIDGITTAIREISKYNLQEGLLISDVGSTKVEICRVAEESLPKGVSFIGGHPMAGSEKSGPKAGDPFLFQNAIYVLSETKLTKDNDLQEFREFLEASFRCRVIELDSKVHDRITATISHVPHLVAVAMVNAADRVNSEIEGTLDLAAGGFKSLTRIASSPYTMWNDILKSNNSEVCDILDIFIDELKETRQLLVNNSLKDKFDSAAETRKRLTVNSKGFLGPLHEIVVVAEDRPGFLAHITKLLADNKINIRDFELLKVREGEAGTIMFAFSSEDEAESAIDLLEGSGYGARLR